MHVEVEAAEAPPASAAQEAGSRLRTWLALALAGVSVGMITVGVLLRRVGAADSVLHEDIMFLVFVTALVGVGGLVAMRRPGNPIGWLLLCSGFLWSGVAITEGYARYAWAQPVRPPGALLTLWIASWIWMPAIFVLPFVLLLFPTGRVPSPRWRPLLLVAAAGLAMTVLAQALVLWGPGGYLVIVEDAGPANPLHTPATAAARRVLAPLGGLMLAVGCVGSVASLIVRFRQAGPIVRQQMKWLVLGVSGALALHVGVSVTTTFLDIGFTRIEGLTFGLLIVSFPVGVGLAVLRYRLYDIDRFISRAVAYAGVTVTLVAIYAVSVIALGTLIRGIAADAGNDLAVAASTLTVAAAFGPVRRRLQAVVDRRFNRTTYDASRTVAEFSGRLRSEMDLDVLVDDLRRVAVDTMGPRSAGVWLPTSVPSR